MTVQDFIVNYSATFDYLHARFGKADVVKLWEFLGQTNLELLEKVEENGLNGYCEYFYGTSGTCTRENVSGGAAVRDGVYEETVDACPSVAELRKRGKRPYRYYCEHCYWLYHYSLESCGYTYDAFFELQPAVGYIDQCRFVAKCRGKLR